MKNFLILSILALSQVSFAQIDRKGNGGDSVAQDFTVSGIQVFNFIIRQKDISQLLNRDSSLIFNDFRKIKIQTEEHLFLNGQEVDAINYPDLIMIKVSRSRWNQLSNDPNSIQLKRSIYEFVG